jgi:GGDEF domain-containing protein
MSGQNFDVLPEEQFRYLLEHECKCALRYQYFFSLLMLQLENLESQLPLLTEIPSLIKNVIRNSDTIGAIQYNKLAILLCCADKPNSIARRILNEIEHKIPHIKIKVGEACFPVNATTAKDLFRESLDRLF